MKTTLIFIIFLKLNARHIELTQNSFIFEILKFILEQVFGLNSTEDFEAVEELRRQLRQRYIDIVVVAVVDSADAMDQVNAVMTSLLQRSREINLVAQVSFFIL